MSTGETYRVLEAASGHLQQAIEALLSPHSVVDCPPALAQTAALLSRVGPAESLRADRAQIEPLLQALTRQSTSAAKLLESAATSYFSQLLGSPVSHTGYAADGSPDKLTDGLSLVMEG